jgi:hypothetical protein
MISTGVGGDSRSYAARLDKLELGDIASETRSSRSTKGRPPSCQARISAPRFDKRPVRG